MSHVNESMRNFVASWKEYSIHRGESNLTIIKKSLQILSSGKYHGAFDPRSPDVSAFLFNLHEFLYSVDGSSPIIGSAIGVLEDICQNSVARRTLMNVYKYIPILTRLLKSQTTNESILRILNLLQDLTYGIQITWQEAYLPELISLLTKWITGINPELVPPSLGVLVNLCHKNLPSLYTLMRTVDLKKFMKVVTRVPRTSDMARFQVCKLVLTLQSVHGGSHDLDEVLSFIKSVVGCLKDALQKNNPSLMKHYVDFFKEILRNEATSQMFYSYSGCIADVEVLLHAVNSEEMISDDCLSVIFDYFHAVIEMKRSDLYPLFPSLAKLALRWVRTEGVSVEALKLLKVIPRFLSANDLVKETPYAKETFEVLEGQLDVLLLLLDVDEESLKDPNGYERPTELLRLLTEISRVPSFCSKISDVLEPNAIKKLFEPLSAASKRKETLVQEPVYTFYIQALSFIAGLDQTHWLLLYSDLVQKSHVLLVMATGLHMGSEVVKKQVLTLTQAAGFPSENLDHLASKMSQLTRFVSISLSGDLEVPPSSPMPLSPMDITPILTVPQEGQLNHILEKYESHIQQNQSSISCPMTMGMLELYQFKATSLEHRLRYMQNSQNAADERVAKLQQSLALSGAETTRLYSLLHESHLAFEVSRSEVAALHKDYQSLRKRSEEDQTKYTEAIKRLEGDLVEAQKTQEELTKTIVSLEENLEQGKKAHNKDKMEIESLKKDLVNQASQYNRAIEKKDEELSKLQKELQEEQKTRKMITQLLSGKG